MKTKRFLLSLLAVACTLLAVLGASAGVAADAASPLTVTIDTGTEVTLTDEDGDGYYEIGTADELYAFAEAVNNANTGINAVLTEDITVNENVLVDGALNSDEAVVAAFRTWTPIGNSTNQYTGTFDGAGHTISGLYVDVTAQ